MKRSGSPFDPDDPKLADDPADRRALPGPEPDVIREEQQDEPPLFDAASVKIQQLHRNRHEHHVENECGQTVSESRVWKRSEGPTPGCTSARLWQVLRTGCLARGLPRRQEA